MTRFVRGVGQPWWWRAAQQALSLAQQIGREPGVYREAVSAAVGELVEKYPLELHDAVCLWLDAARGRDLVVPDGMPVEGPLWAALLLVARRDGNDAALAALLVPALRGPDLVGDLTRLLEVLGASLGRRPVSLRPVWGAA